jgi:pimeloyl-ACP methyl ester carboxylesterase
MGQFQKPVVLAVHGALSDRRSWNSLTKSLAPIADIVSFDLDGFGKKNTASMQFERHVAQVLLHAQSYGKPVTLLGWSYGGTVAAGAAASNPDLFNGVIYFDASINCYLPATLLVLDAEREFARRIRNCLDQINVSQHKKAFQFTNIVCDRHIDAPSELPSFAKDIIRENAYSLSQFLKIRQPTRLNLGTITKPQFVINGEFSPLRYRAIGRAIYEDCMDGGYYCLPGASHDAPYSNPNRLARVIRDFLNQIRM